MSMSFTLTEEQQAICDEAAKLCAPFDDDYWLEHDRSAEFPFDFHRAVAEGRRSDMVKLVRLIESATT